MSAPATSGLSPAIAELDEIVDHLARSRERAASAFASEMFFFARIADLVERRERERAARDAGAVTDASQLAMREVFAELGAALRLSEWQVARKVSTAWTLTALFHETLCDASCGAISAEHATVIAEVGGAIESETVRRHYEAVALDLAMELTAGQLKPALQGLVQRLDPEGTEHRVREAAARRRVCVRELEDGLVRITAEVPTAQGVGIGNRLRDLATELCAQNAAQQADATLDDDSTAPDERTHAQLMADVFCDLLLTNAVTAHGAGAPARDALNAITATVHVTVPATTLAGTTVGGAAVTGFGAVDDDTARRLAGSAPMWTRVFTDPGSGAPLSVDRYRPSKEQRLFLQVRDEQCRFPGCRRPAQKCDIDHTLPHAEGGPTRLGNLAHLCRRHHTLKHCTDWSVEQLPGGVLRWTAPTRRTHVIRPPGTVRFVPTDPAPF